MARVVAGLLRAAPLLVVASVASVAAAQTSPIADVVANFREMHESQAIYRAEALYTEALARAVQIEQGSPFPTFEGTWAPHHDELRAVQLPKMQEAVRGPCRGPPCS